MYKVIIVKPRIFSRGAVALRNEFNSKRIRTGTVYTRNRGWAGNRACISGTHLKASHMIVNWGCSTTQTRLLSTQRNCFVLNNPSNVAEASNKLSFFRNMLNNGSGDYIPAHYDSYRNVPRNGLHVARTILNGSGGDGIVIGEKADLPTDAPLYTKYIKKAEEFRVHVGRSGDIIGVQRKALRNDADRSDPDLWKVRNHSRGFVFVRNDDYFASNPELLDRICALARTSINNCRLDFGAVDIIWNAQGNCVYALEVNTAPGLEGQTVHDYVDNFKGYIDDLDNDDF